MIPLTRFDFKKYIYILTIYTYKLLKAFPCREFISPLGYYFLTSGKGVGITTAHSEKKGDFFKLINTEL